MPTTMEDLIKSVELLAKEVEALKAEKAAEKRVPEYSYGLPKAKGDGTSLERDAKGKPIPRENPAEVSNEATVKLTREHQYAKLVAGVFEPGDGKYQHYLEAYLEDGESAVPFRRDPFGKLRDLNGAAIRVDDIV